MESLFDGDADPEQDAFLRRVAALVAPVAANAGAVVDEPGLTSSLADREVEDAVCAGRFRVDQPHERARAVVMMCDATDVVAAGRVALNLMVELR
jgi:predicted RNase H-like nuclease (RuvC/YqgF family)